MPTFRLQLGLAVATAALLPLVALGGFALAAGKAELTSNAEDRVSDRAHDAATLLESESRGLLLQLEVQASRPDVRDVLRSGDASAAYADIAKVVDLFPLCDSMAYLDARGRVIAEVPPLDNLPPDASATGYFLGPMSTVASSLTALDDTGASRYAAGVAARDPDTSVVGIVTCAMSTGAIAERLYSAQAEGDAVVVLDSASRVLAHPDVQVMAVAPSYGAHEAVRAWWNGETAAARATDPDTGEPVLAAAAPVAGTDWLVVASVPTEAAFAPIVGFTNVLVATGIAAVLGAFGLAWVVGGRMSLPIANLAAATDQLTAKRYEVRVDEEYGPEEVRRLARSLNAMASEIGWRDSELVRYAESLEAKVAERTDALRERNSELEAANHRLQEADRVKSAFLANMSHELRTPLNAIIGYTELALAGTFGPLNEKQSKRLNTVLESAKHLLGLINDVLDISKVQSGRMEMHAEDVPLDALFAEARELVEPLAAKKGIGIDVGIPHVPHVRADRVRLKQCLLNYLSNAVKFTPEGGRVTLRVTADGELARISVFDTGPGIKPEDVPKLFQDFSQIDSSTTRKHGGTGLGLALTRRLTELMGGTVGMRDGPNGGSEFWLTVPAATGATVAVREVPVSVARTRTRARVLVVEDDAEPQERLRLALGAAGFDVDVARTGPEALARMRERTPDAVVLDVILPGGMDGWEIYRAMRREASTAEVPVFFTSQSDARDLAIALGATAFFTKPVEASVVVRAVEAAVAGGPRRVLVVDDDPSMRDAFVSLFAARGIACATVSDGALAMDAMRQDAPAAVVLDLMMPGMDGFAVLDAMRADARLADVPVFVVTAKDLTDAERRRLVAKANAVYAKGSNVLEAVLAELSHHRIAPVRTQEA